DTDSIIGEGIHIHRSTTSDEDNDGGKEVGDANGSDGYSDDDDSENDDDDDSDDDYYDDGGDADVDMAGRGAAAEEDGDGVDLSSLLRCEALFDFEARSANEVSFKKGDVLFLFNAS